MFEGDEWVDRYGVALADGVRPVLQTAERLTERPTVRHGRTVLEAQPLATHAIVGVLDILPGCLWGPVVARREDVLMAGPEWDDVSVADAVAGGWQAVNGATVATRTQREVTGG
jgi:hypothetical protein